MVSTLFDTEPMPLPTWSVLTAQPSGTTRTTAPTPADTWMSTTSCGQIACWKSSFTVDIPALRLRYAGTVQIPRRT